MSDATPNCSTFESFPNFITGRFTATDLLAFSFLLGVLFAIGVGAVSGEESVATFAVVAILYVAIAVLFAGVNSYKGIETITGDSDD